MPTVLSEHQKRIRKSTPIPGHFQIFSTWEQRKIANGDIPQKIVVFHLVFSSGRWPVTCERFGDGSWAAYFSDEDGIIASGKSFKEAMVNLISEADDFLDEVSQYEPNISPELEHRLNFIRKVLG